MIARRNIPETQIPRCRRPSVGAAISISVVGAMATPSALVVVMGVVARCFGATPYQIVDMESPEQLISEERRFDCEDPTRKATPGYEAVEEVGGEEGEVKVVREHGYAGTLEQAYNGLDVL